MDVSWASDGKTISMLMDGVPLTATLGADGTELRWSDGDVWTRVERPRQSKRSRLADVALGNTRVRLEDVTRQRDAESELAAVRREPKMTNTHRSVKTVTTPVLVRGSAAHLRKLDNGAVCVN